MAHWDSQTKCSLKCLCKDTSQDKRRFGWTFFYFFFGFICVVIMKSLDGLETVRLRTRATSACPNTHWALAEILTDCQFINPNLSCQLLWHVKLIYDLLKFLCPSLESFNAAKRASVPCYMAWDRRIRINNHIWLQTNASKELGVVNKH